ncbi:MAG: SGNH/GDSL hydrolase family protein [Chlamydiae bacterium]|nr:SGNH/GDSL hydrolase family protein [Chlamydiota bacterium]MBI3276207.1 SGNH/GDSL hydrolase family protein [Chlamydiota bacterium]
MFFKKVTFMVCTVFGIFLLLVVTAEIFLRISGIWIGRHTDTMFKVMQYDENLGWRMKPNISTQMDLVDVENIPVRSNSLGFRDKEFVLEKPSGKLRIVFLGDSFAWGFVREEERLTNLLAVQQGQWDILNFGIPGYGTDQSLLVWETLASKYKPDVVVLTIYKNDYVDNASVVNDGRQKPYFEWTDQNELILKNVPVDKKTFWENGIFNQIAPPYQKFYPQPIQKRSRILHWLVKNSNLVRWIYTLSRAHRPAPAVQAFFYTDKNSLLDERTFLQERLLDRLVKRLAAEVRSTNAQFVVVFSGDMTASYQRQMESLKTAGILYVDGTTPSIARFLKSEEKDIYYKYSGHWTPGANEIVARLVGDVLSSLVHRVS